MDTAYCVEALKKAQQAAGCWPEIMNTDQGSQFISDEWVSELKAANVQVSMDSRGCWVGNVFIERPWQVSLGPALRDQNDPVGRLEEDPLKYKDIYLRNTWTYRT